MQGRLYFKDGHSKRYHSCPNLRPELDPLVILSTLHLVFFLKVYVWV